MDRDNTLSFISFFFFSNSRGPAQALAQGQPRTTYCKSGLLDWLCTRSVGGCLAQLHALSSTTVEVHAQSVCECMSVCVCVSRAERIAGRYLVDTVVD